jgi:hypothetical protein
MKFNLIIRPLPNLKKNTLESIRLALANDVMIYDEHELCVYLIWK